ncbi:MAG: Ig-like domain-containing protein [Bacteroides sp.]
MNFSEMFRGCKEFTGAGLEGWNVSKCQDFSYMFSGAFAFNGLIGKWNVGKGRSFKRMFSDCRLFTADISSWRPLAAETTSGMFVNCKLFNRDLSAWRMPRLLDMSFMFTWCPLFKCELKDWDVAQVRNFENAFQGCSAFESDLSQWNVKSGENFVGMFYACTLFQSDLSKWDLSLAKNMKQMFYKAPLFTSDLSDWNVAKVTDMSDMFKGATNFNSDVTRWNVKRVSDMSGIFEDAYAFNCQLGTWDISGLTNKSISLNKCGMGVANYERTLEGWAKLSGVPTGITLEADMLHYTDAVKEFRENVLKNIKNWKFQKDIKSSASEHKLELTPTLMTINLGNALDVTYKITPDVTNPSLNWTSTDETIAAYNLTTKKVEGKKVGSAIIRCQYGSNAAERAYDELFVDVVIFVDKLEFKQDKYDRLPLGETFDFAKEIIISPKNATNKRLKWMSDKPDIISIDENTGLATCHKVGDAKISVVARDREEAHAAKAEVPVKVIVIQAEAIEADPKEINAKPGTEITLGVKFTPENVTYKDVEWTSPEEGKIKVIDKAKGIFQVLDDKSNPNYGGFVVDLKVTHKDKETGNTLEAICRVHVLVKSQIFPEKLTVSPESLEMNIHEEKEITATLIPSNVFNSDLVWLSKNSKVATVKDGKVTAVGEGETTILVWSVVDRNVFAQTRVKVNKVLVSELLFLTNVPYYNESLKLYEIPAGVASTIPYSIEPQNASNREVKWETENPDVVSIDERTGRITGLAAGVGQTAVIKATALGGSNIYKTCKVKVVELSPTRSISIQRDLFVVPDTRGKFTLTFNPEDANDRLVEWASTDPSIFTVYPDGSYWAREAGDVTVTVTLVSDPLKKAICKVKVLPRLATQSIKILSELNLGVGAQYKYTPVILPLNSTDRDVEWKIRSGKMNITLDALTGIVQGIKKGAATVRVSLKSNPTIYAESEITVVDKKELTSEIKFEKESYELAEGEYLDLKLVYEPTDANDLALEFTSANDTYVVVVNSPMTYAAARIFGRLFSDGQEITVTGKNLKTGQTFSTKVKVTTTQTSEAPVPTGFEPVLKSLTILEGNTGYIELKNVQPKNSDPRKLSWISEKGDVVEVSPTGSVFGKKEGKSKVTISGSGHTATVMVYVVKQGGGSTTPQDPNNPNNPDPNKPALVNFFAPDKTPVQVVVGNYTYIRLKTEPEGANTGNLTWTSEEPRTAEVKNGILKGIAVGKTKVTVSDKNGKSVTFDVEVVKRPAGEDPSKPNLVDFYAPEPLPVTVMLLSEKKVHLRVIPANADISRLEWKSNDETKVTVKNGTIRGEKLGATTLTVSDPLSGRTVTFPVEVVAENNPNNPDPNKPALEEFFAPDNNPVGVLVGGITYVHLKTKPEGADTSGMTWVSEDTSTAEVENGVLKGIKVGSTNVTVSKNGKSVTFGVVVKPRPANEDPNKPSLVDFDVPEKLPVTVALGAKKKVQLKVTPADADISRLEWTSNDESIVKVDNTGVMTGIFVGTTTLKVHDPISNRSITFAVETIAENNPNNPDPNKPALEQFFAPENNPVGVIVGGYTYVHLKTQPEGADTSGLTWTSEDPTTADVRNGVLMGVKEGTTTVTVSDGKGNEVKFGVVVKPRPATEDPNKPSLIDFDVPKKLPVGVVLGGWTRVRLTVTPADADISRLKWTSNNENIVTVDQNGKMSGIALGKTTLMVHDPVSGRSIEFEVEVVENPGDPSKPILNDFDKQHDNPVEVEVGKKKPLPIKTEPEGADKSRLTYESKDKSVATVDKDGNVTGVKLGETTVKVTDPVSGKTIEFVIKVVEKSSTPSKPALESFSVVRTALYVVQNFDAIVPLNLVPEDADTSSLVWTTEDDKIASVSESGVITGVALGQTMVRVMHPATNREFKINVTVIANDEKTLAVEENQLADVTAAPNPFATQLTLRGYKTTNGRYELMTLAGVTLRAGLLWSDETQIETADLPAGLYLIRLTTETGETKTLKVVKR